MKGGTPYSTAANLLNLDVGVIVKACNQYNISNSRGFTDREAKYTRKLFDKNKCSLKEVSKLIGKPIKTIEKFLKYGQYILDNGIIINNARNNYY